MRLITVNLNGIRSAAKKGFFSWLDKQNADVICMQEIRAHQSQLQDKVFFPSKYHTYFFDAQKKGYSGVAIYAKKEPDKLVIGLDKCILVNEEARYIQVDYGNLSITSTYIPSGTSGDARQKIKYIFLDQYLAILKKQMKDKRSYMICGDFNIAHKNIDLKNWRSNQDHSGFLPEERAWLDVVFDEVGFIDAFRYKYPTKEQYTWWSNRARAWENNVGWRIDYQIVTPDLKDCINKASVYRKQKFSDHAPLIMDYDLN